MNYQSDVVIIGGGVAGMMCALELLDRDKSVTLIDKDIAENFGGQAKESFGGVFICDSPTQRRNGIKDNFDLAYKDWCSFAEFNEDDTIPKEWAKMYIKRSKEDLFDGLGKYGVRFFPVVHWVERGLFKPGNSVPRFHMIWGTGKGLTDCLIRGLKAHKNYHNFTAVFEHDVKSLIMDNGIVSGCKGLTLKDGKEFEAKATNVVIASGGVGANLEVVRKNWHSDWSTPPDDMLIGCHKYADGQLHDAVKLHGANITHLDKMWNYAAGIEHPRKKHPYGLSLVPPKSALWMNSKGDRIGPIPLITAFDTRYLVQEVCKQEKQFSWHIMNEKIALKELAASGSESNENFRDKKIFKILLSILFGNKKFVKEMTTTSDNIVVAENLDDLVKKMNPINEGSDIDVNNLRKNILDYDNNIDRGQKFHNDEQLRRIAHTRQYKGDKARTCKFQKILDPSAGPLIAIKMKILVRKSLGGIQTNTKSQILKENGEVMKGLYAIGEAAGFGGGGVHGLRALEGTFLGGCVVSAKACGREIGKD